MALQVYSVVRCTPRICMDLKPIPLLEPIQLAEAQVRDLKEEIATLNRKLAACERAREENAITRALLLKCERDLIRGKTTSRLRWKARSTEYESSDQFIFQPDGSILFCSSGSYELFLLVGHHLQTKPTGIFVVTQFRDPTTTTTKKCWNVHTDGSLSYLWCSISIASDDKLAVWVRTARAIRVDAALAIFPFKRP